MRLLLSGFIILIAMMFSGTPADASRRGERASVGSEWWSSSMGRASSDDAEDSRESGNGRRVGAKSRRMPSDNDSSSGYSSGRSSGAGPRPAQWCGWWMRTQRGGGPEYNLAWNWTKYGSPGSPQVGAVVVWRHHVGEITGRASNGQWIVKSGNDGGRVRERPRSIAGAVIRV
jgi:hypothetical protein